MHLSRLNNIFAWLQRPQGFAWNEQQDDWVGQNFRLGDEKFLVKEEADLTPNVKDGTRFSVTPFGDSFPKYDCTRYGIEDFEGTRVVCGGLGMGFVMDTETLRYQEFYGIGYVGTEDRTKNTPSLTIGTCVAL